MVSLLDAEEMMALNVGKPDLPSIKIKKAFDEAINTAQQDELKHLEAYASERAALHFENAGLDGHCGDYIKKAHFCYDNWNASAKIVAIEEKYGKFLNLKVRRTRPYDERGSPQGAKQSIKVGRSEIKPITMKKVVKNTRRNIKELFGMNKEKDKEKSPRRPPKSPGVDSEEKKKKVVIDHSHRCHHQRKSHHGKFRRSHFLDVKSQTTMNLHRSDPLLSQVQRYPNQG